MRVLLRPVLVPELGLVIVKPGRESMPVFHNTRLLVEPEPKSMRNLPSGVVPAVRQPLVEDKTLLPFFSNARVIRAAGGAGALSDWLLRHIKSCQWPHGDYHHSETVIHRYGTGAMVLCWHCDNQLRDQTSESLGQLAHQNLSAWMIDVIGHAISGTQERELSLSQVFLLTGSLNTRETKGTLLIFVFLTMALMNPCSVSGWLHQSARSGSGFKGSRWISRRYFMQFVQ